MRISHTHRFIFLSVPRSSSTTVRSILNDYSDVKSINRGKTSDDFPFAHHITAAELKSIFDQKGWDWFSYKRFCVVRNPYDRVVSLYHSQVRKKERKIDKKNLVVPNLEMSKEDADKVNKTRKKRKKKDPTSSPSFREYVMSIKVDKKLPAPLTTYICDEQGNFLIDDVLMYEKLNIHLPDYLKTLGIHISSEDIPHLNASKNRGNYRDYYDDETKEEVSRLYAYEIERFGYSF